MSGSLSALLPVPLSAAAAQRSSASWNTRTPAANGCGSPAHVLNIALLALGLALALGGLTTAAADTGQSLPPAVTGFTPVSGIPGTLVIVNGSNLVNVVSIQFNGLAAPVYGATEDGTAVQTQVPAGAASGPITVVTPGGTTTSTTDFEVGGLGPPVVSAFTPASGPVGTEITIQGSNLVHVSSVRFNGTDATFSTFVGLTAFVPTNATTGPITVTTQQGSFTTEQSFAVTSVGAPVITGFSPLGGYPGTVVVLTGTNLTLSAHVLFGDVPGDSVTLMAGQLWTQVPLGAQTAPITVETDAGRTTTTNAFVVTPVPPPAITDVSPVSARPGEWVTLRGTNFISVQSVTVHDVSAVFSQVGSDLISMQAPYAPDAPVTVQTAGGTAVSTQTLTVIGGPPAPMLIDFTPTNGLGGTEVTLHAANVELLKAVLFNDLEAEFTRNGSNIVAIVPAFARSGPITIKTGQGNATTSSDFVTYNTGELGAQSAGSPNPVMWNQPLTWTLLLTNFSTNALSDLIVTNVVNASPGSDIELDWSTGVPQFASLISPLADIQSLQASQGSATATNAIILWQIGALPIGSVAELTVLLAPRGPQHLQFLTIGTGQSALGQAVTAGAVTSVLVTGIIPLTVAPAVGGQIAVAWPDTSQQYVLQSADAALSTAVWKDVSAPVQIVEGQSVVLLPAQAACEFFRLVQRP